MKKYLILLGIVFIIALLLSRVIYVLTFERWAVILLAFVLFFTVKKKFRH